MSLPPINSMPRVTQRTGGSLGAGGLAPQLDTKSVLPDSGGPKKSSGSDGKRSDGVGISEEPVPGLQIEGAGMGEDGFQIRDARRAPVDAPGKKSSTRDDRRAENTIDSNRITPTPSRGLGNDNLVG
jgi:hypothetical protein